MHLCMHPELIHRLFGCCPDALPQLRSLDISNASLHVDQQALEAVRRAAPRLRALDVFNCDQVDDRALAAVAQWPSLHTLTVGGRQATVTDECAEHIRTLQLEELTLSSRHLTDQGIARALQGSEATLQRLFLCGGTALGGLGPAHCQRLRVLHLCHCGLDDAAFAASMQQLGGHLERLSVCAASNLGPAGLAALARHAVALQSLNVGELAAVDDVFLQQLRAPQLGTLVLAACHNVTDAGVASLARFARLQVLNARDCPSVGDRGLCPVVLRCCRTSVEEQVVAAPSDAVDDAGLPAAAAAAAEPAALLRVLDLRNTGATDALLVALAAQPLHQLEMLRCGPHVSDAGLTTLMTALAAGCQVCAEHGAAAAVPPPPSRQPENHLHRTQLLTLDVCGADVTGAFLRRAPAAALERLRVLALHGPNLRSLALRSLARAHHLQELHCIGCQRLRALPVKRLAAARRLRCVRFVHCERLLVASVERLRLRMRSRGARPACEIVVE